MTDLAKLNCSPLAGRDRIESLTEHWVSQAATKCLSAVLKRREKSVNVIVTNSQLVAAFVKLILNDLSHFFPAHNIYSSSKVGKVKLELYADGIM